VLSEKTKGALKAQRARTRFLSATNYGFLVLAVLPVVPVFLLPAFILLALPMFLLFELPMLLLFMLLMLALLVVVVLVVVVVLLVGGVVLLVVVVVEVLVVVFVFAIFVLSPPPQPVQNAAMASKARKAKVLRIEFSPVTQRGNFVKELMRNNKSTSARFDASAQVRLKSEPLQQSSLLRPQLSSRRPIVQGLLNLTSD
jgi:hypothetical protein